MIRILLIKKEFVTIAVVKQQFNGYDIFTIYTVGRDNGKTHYDRSSMHKVCNRLMDRGFKIF